MTKFAKVFVAALFVSGSAFAQTEIKQKEKEKVPNNWYHLDPNSGYQGISLEKAYSLLKSKNLKSNRVVVAVIDSGIDTLHEDLKPVLWTNSKEIPGNGIDDDKNGYTDDVHGWNFLGGKDGRNVKQDSYEAARVYYKLKSKWEGKDVDESTLNPAERDEYTMFHKARKKTVGDTDESSEMQLVMLKRMQVNMTKSDSLLKIAMGKNVYTGEDLEAFKPQNSTDSKAKSSFLAIMKGIEATDQTNTEFMEGFNGYVSGEERKVEARKTPPKEYRKEIVGDDESRLEDIDYGNNDIMASTPFHGTHCSGIIAAARENGKGIDGIADNVRIMMLRAVPDGDEHDKDIANAIRYAVNNGAKIISMSFGKNFSPEKHWVDDAFRYAETKGVLLVHAAGNDAKDIDTEDNYPNPIYKDGSGRAANVITVGASGNMKNGGITASFSNYGKGEVDVFAPGVSIYSTIPGGTTYGNASGTSMACPVVAGVAALVLQHYPNMTPQQLKYVIEKSATPPSEKVNKPGSDELVELKDISKTGGLVNAYEAVKLAGSLSAEKQKTTLPKPKMKKTKVG